MFIDENGNLITGKMEKSIDSGSDVLVMEEPENSISDDTESRAILYNDEYHSFHQVVNQLKKAINCTDEVGLYHAYIIHNKGKSIVFSGPKSECGRVVKILKEINLSAEVK